MPNTNAVVQISDHSQGLITVIPPHLIPDGATPSYQNVDFTRKLGAISRRKGTSVEYTENVIATFSDVGGLYQAVFSGGTDKIVGSAGDEVFSLTAPGTWTQIFTDSGLDGENVRFAMFNDLLIVVNESITTQKWTGSGSTSNLGGSPPANVKYIAAHRQKVFMANSSAGKSRLHFSVTDNPEDWTTLTGANRAGFIEVNLDDGDEITGIASMGRTLVITKKYSCFLLHGYKGDNFTLQQIPGSVGCIAPNSLRVVEGMAIFLADRGVYGLSQDGELTLLSQNIQHDIEDLALAAKVGAAGGVYQTQYWLAYDSDASNGNDSAYVLDYVRGIWTKYTNINARVFHTTNAGVLLSGGSEKIIVREHNDTENDEGSAIDMRYETKDFAFGSFAVDKDPEEVYIMADAISGKTLTVDTVVDGDEKDDDASHSLTATGSNTYVYVNDWIQEADGVGRYVRLKFSNNETAAPIVIYEYLLSAKVREREGT